MDASARSGRSLQAATCDAGHSYLPCGVAKDAKGKWTFATKHVYQHPTLLCQRIAALVIQEALQKHIHFPPAHLTTDDASLPARKLTRLATGRQPRGRALPQIIPEFSRTATIMKSEFGDGMKILRHLLPAETGDDSGSQNDSKILVGMYFPPAAFIEQSLAAKHPYDLPLALPDLIKSSITSVLSMGAPSVMKHRIQALRLWCPCESELNS